MANIFMCLVQMYLHLRRIRASHLLEWEKARRLRQARFRRRLLRLEDMTRKHQQWMRRRLLRMASLTILIMKQRNNAQRVVRRRLWSHPHPQLWWDMARMSKDERDWRANFRMSKETFDFVTNAVRPYLERQRTNWRMPISVEKRVAVGLWRLATGCKYKTVQDLFGIGRSTACETFEEFVTAVVASLKGQFLVRPSCQEVFEITQGFKDIWGFPQCAGVIDRTHIPVSVPHENRNDYYNQKGWYSIIMQAVCDHKYCFWDVEVARPGKVCDAHVFSNSPLYAAGDAGKLFPDNNEQFNKVDVPIFLIGDPSYPLLSWLMKAYPEHAGTPQEHLKFNYRMSRAQMCIKNAFGRLKGRWRCLRKQIDNDISIVPTIVIACCILHNLCESRSEAFDVPQNNKLLEVELSQPTRDSYASDNREACASRDALCAHLA